jgi:hypothetical protein
MLELFQDGVEAVLERVRLKELRSGAGMEEQALSPRSYVLLERIRQGRSKVDVPFPVLRLHVRLDHSALGFLPNVQRAKVRADVFAHFEPERFPGPQRPTTSQESVKHPILTIGRFKNLRYALDGSGGLALVSDEWRVDKLLVPRPREDWLSLLVDRGRDDALYDVRVIPNRRRRQFGNVVHELFHGHVIDLG